MPNESIRGFDLAINLPGFQLPRPLSCNQSMWMSRWRYLPMRARIKVTIALLESVQRRVGNSAPNSLSIDCWPSPAAAALNQPYDSAFRTKSENVC